MTILQNEDDPYEDLRRLTQRDFPESWVPSTEDPVLVGTFERLESAQTAYGPASIVVLKTKDSRERGLWLFHTVLKNEFKRARPEHGELVAVRYLGRKQGSQGQSYEAYRVVVQRDGTPDWDALGSTDVAASATLWEESKW